MFRILFLVLLFACVAPFFIKGDDGKPLVTPAKAITWGVNRVPKAWVGKAASKLGVPQSAVQSFTSGGNQQGSGASASWSPQQLQSTLGALASLARIAQANGMDVQQILSQNGGDLQKLAGTHIPELQELMKEHGSDMQRLMKEHGTQIQQLMQQHGGDLQQLVSQHQAEIEQAIQNPEAARRLAESHKAEIKAAVGK